MQQEAPTLENLKLYNLIWSKQHVSVDSANWAQ